MTTNYIGQPANRVDGVAKVTGEAKYAAEFNAPGLVHGVVISSPIAKGKIKNIDATKALSLAGVLQVFSHKNRPDLAWFNSKYADEDAPPGDHFWPFYKNEIQFSLQPIALVVAETLELATYAAKLVQFEFEPSSFETDLHKNEVKSYVPKKGKSSWQPPQSRGQADKVFAKADATIEAEYAHGAQHHNPMEMHASTVVYESNGSLTIHDKTQGPINSQTYVCNVFGLAKEKVHIVSPFIGGAFGSGLRPQYQLFMAVLAALELKRPVKVMLTRPQMFSFGHRPATIQRFALSASSNGILQSVKHEAVAETSQFENYTENVVPWSGLIYNCSHVALNHKLVQLDEYTPLDMRAPGAATGVNAFEAAIDELAYAAGIDPLEFRIKNYSEKDQNQDVPYSSKELMACYKQGAEKFGWSKRNLKPRSMKEGTNLVGWGVATGVWEAEQEKASAKAVLTPDGKLTVSSATADIGTGTYTVMTQVAADTLGLPLEAVTAIIGDSSLPQAPLSGGSWTAASIGSAVKQVCVAVQQQLLKLAQKQSHSPLKGAGIEDVVFENGHIKLKNNTSAAIAITNIMHEQGVNSIEEETTTTPSSDHKKYGRYTHSAIFAEVKVDEDLGTIKVTRVVNAVAAGKIINPKTAKSQVLGGVVWGIGMAMQEDTFMDHTFGRYMNHDLAEYHVPVNADINTIDVIFVEEHDPIVNPLGIKGLGEIGIVGTAAAIANAVFHATGKRVRDYPITLDKLL